MILEDWTWCYDWEKKHICCVTSIDPTHFSGGGGL